VLVSPCQWLVLVLVLVLPVILLLVVEYCGVGTSSGLGKMLLHFLIFIADVPFGARA
jgi:hypothetical protein